MINATTEIIRESITWIANTGDKKSASELTLLLPLVKVKDVDQGENFDWQRDRDWHRTQRQSWTYQGASGREGRNPTTTTETHLLRKAGNNSFKISHFIARSRVTTISESIAISSDINILIR